MTNAFAEWIVVIPFKGAPNGKSRLAAPAAQGAGGFDVGQRSALAFAFLQDTISAVAATGPVRQVLVVSASPDVNTLEAAFPLVCIVADPGGGLNTAVAAGIHEARLRSPRARVAAMTGDLPVLQSADLLEALRFAEQIPLGVCADRSGEGSTMITVAPGAEVVPRFGVGSFARHVGCGHVPIPVDSGSTLHFDVDSADDLSEARNAGFGFGESTSSILASIGR